VRPASLTFLSPVVLALLHQDSLLGAQCRPLDVPANDPMPRRARFPHMQSLPNASPAPVSQPTIEEVQGSPGELTIVVALNGVPSGTGVDESGVTASVEGIDLDVGVEAISDTNDLDQTAMLVMDTSDSMAGEKLTAAQDAASDFVAGIPADVAVGLITFDSEARVVVEPTTEHAQVDSAIDSFLSWARVERGLAENTLEAYGRDLGEFAKSLVKAGVQDVSTVRSTPVL